MSIWLIKYPKYNNVPKNVNKGINSLNVSPRRSRRGHQCGNHDFEVVVDCENRMTNRECRLSMSWLRVNKVTFYLFNFTIYVDKQTDTK